MTNKERQVTSVLEPNFGEGLRSLATQSHVWVIDTPANRNIAEEFWQEHSSPTQESGITTFKMSEDETTEQTVLHIIGTIELHQGEYSCDPPYSVLEVFGQPITERIKAALEDKGFAIIEERGKGFRSVRGPS